MSRPRSVILDAAEASVLYRDGSLILLRPCPSQPFVEKAGVAANDKSIPDPVWEGVPTSSKVWHVYYPGIDGGGHGIYESEEAMLTEYQSAMLAKFPGQGKQVNIREPWECTGETEHLPFSWNTPKSERSYRHASREIERPTSAWRSPAQMPRKAVQMTPIVASIEIARLRAVEAMISQRDPFKSLIGERLRRDLPVRGSSWWDARSFARRDRGTAHDQNPYVYVTRLENQGGAL